MFRILQKFNILIICPSLSKPFQPLVKNQLSNLNSLNSYSTIKTSSSSSIQPQNTILFQQLKLQQKLKSKELTTAQFLLLLEELFRIDPKKFSKNFPPPTTNTKNKSTGNQKSMQSHPYPEWGGQHCQFELVAGHKLFQLFYSVPTKLFDFFAAAKNQRWWSPEGEMDGPWKRDNKFNERTMQKSGRFLENDKIFVIRCFCNRMEFYFCSESVYMIY